MLAPFFAPPVAATSLDAPLSIERAEILAFDGHFFARVGCGAHWGIVALGDQTPALISLWQTRVLPFWIGRDARALQASLAEIHRSNAALASAPFWMAVSAIELALWDLLGQASGRGVAALLAAKPRKRVPVYLSGARCNAEAEAEAEIARLEEAVAATGAKAVEVKIGEPDERNRALLRAARDAWGEKFVIYADAEGALEADRAVEIGQLLREWKVAWLEEPCPWEDFEATRAVAASVELPVAGGRWESSWPRWKWALENCALDIARPDLARNGGLGRSFALAQFAAQLGVLSAPHSPVAGPQALPALHLAAALEKPAPFFQWDAHPPAAPSWFGTPLEVSKGAVALPKGAGWGAVYDAEIWNRAEILAAASV